MQATHDRADGAAHDAADFLVRELLDIAQDDGQPELRGKGVERATYFFFDQRSEGERLRVAEMAHRARAHPPVREGIGVGTVEHGSLEATPPVFVDERVR